MQRLSLFLSLISVALVGVVLWQLHRVSTAVDRNSEQMTATIEQLTRDREPQLQRESMQLSESLVESLELNARALAELQRLLNASRSNAPEQVSEPSEFSPVKVILLSESGGPLKGVAVTLQSTDEGIRPVKVEGTSGEDGVALTRDLPYGNYRMNVRGPSGWSHSSKFNVEIGVPEICIVTAPDPYLVGTVRIKSNMSEDTFGGLVFGTLTQDAGSGYTVARTPEPEEEQGGFRGFPVLGEGVTTAAVRFEISVERQIRQSDGSKASWYWRPDGPRLLHTLMVTADGTFLRLHDTNVERARPENRETYFGGLNGSDEKVGYLLANTEELPESSVDVEVAVGEVTVAIDGIYGLANDELSDLLKPNADDSREVWLPTNLRGSSQWMSRIFDLDDWRREDNIRYLAKQTFVLVPNETHTVSVAAPEE